MKDETKEMKWRWKRVGYCNLCGDCCNVKNFFNNDFVDNPDIQTDEDGYCRFFNKKERTCTIQYSKPIGCMKFPSAPSDIFSFPNCSYRFIREYYKEK